MALIRAVLFDVGGPLDTEIIYERLIDEHMREALVAEGIAVTSSALADAERRAVECFAPNAYGAIIFDLCGADSACAERAYAAVAARSDDRHAARGGFELRPGVPELLERLCAHGVALGLAANQPADAIAHMDAAGIAKYFSHRGVSGTHGYRKPDVRVFLDACHTLDVTPAECIMVGDRIDNDIVPARVLGMRTVLFRTGRHRNQRPRSWDEAPDVEVSDIAALGQALLAMISGE